MNLLDLTLRNVRRNFQLYTIYLFSLIIGVIIQFTFSSLMFNQDILDVIANRAMFQQGVSIASVAVVLFIIFFLIYANSFFMRQRKKELGMYLLFGMKERQITKMVFYETLCIGAISLAAGILLGGLLSKLFGRVLMNLMQYDQVISLAFPPQAIGTTVGVFLLFTLIITIQSDWAVRRLQLVELFRAKEKMEKPIRASAVWAVLSLLLLGEAFMLILSGSQSVFWEEKYSMYSLLGVAVGVVGGTYLFFRQFIGWLLQAISRMRRYFEGVRPLWTSSLRFQVRSNALNLTFITLFSTMIMLLISFVAINYKVQFEAVGKNVPNHIAFQTLDRATNERIEALINSSEHPVTEHTTLQALRVKAVTDRNVAFENAEYYFEDVLLVSEQAYEAWTERRGDSQPVTLQGREAIALSQGMDFPTPLAPGEQLAFAVEPGYEFKLVERKDFALLGWATDPEEAMDKKPGVLVVSDDAYRELSRGGQAHAVTFELYMVENAKTADQLSRDVYAIVSQTPGVYYSSFADIYSKQIESSALLLFSAAFPGRHRAVRAGERHLLQAAPRSDGGTAAIRHPAQNRRGQRRDEKRHPQKAAARVRPAARAGHSDQLDLHQNVHPRLGAGLPGVGRDGVGHHGGLLRHLHLAVRLVD